MIDPIAFILATLLLLGTPGPTNTLLATSGAAAGLRPSLRLLGAELSGYMISILVLTLALGPLVRGNPMVGVTLKVLCSAYLVWLAIKLWREGSSALISTDPVKFRRVFTTTLLNPKAVIFAFTILPHLADGRLVQGLPYLLGLCAMIVLVGGSWIALGAGIRAGSAGQLPSGVVRRVGAGALVVFAMVLGSSAWTTAQAVAAAAH
jgi:threonine/homoserine/homoserine lactone efflux protein